MSNNCLHPEMCLLSENDVPCAICPNAKEKADDRLARTACSPLGIAVSGYLKNRFSLVEALGNVSFVYGQNGHDKSKRISKEIARLDVIVAGLVSPENAAPEMVEALERIRDYQGLFGEDDPQSIAADMLAKISSANV